MNECVLYIHGKGGSAAEADHYRPLFSCDVVGIEYNGGTPWEAAAQIAEAALALKERYGRLILIANSVGAYFSMCAGIDQMITRAFFISPVVDMERLIGDMMKRRNVTEAELENRRTIPTDAGEALSWDYLRYVREHPVNWSAPTAILCGENDSLIPYAEVAAFAEKTGARLSVMKGGGHWFHTKDQMRFLDDWIKDGMNSHNVQ